ncbi:ABC transporter permease [Cytobacillus oceanisediminis]|uniref:ABC transporter permease n=1 Tax=Niallia alba TaxID=2729105 RepID=A0A7Y0K6G2_9BACI|nr:MULTISPECIES: ABC transporter permease [Bacillaceae]EOR25101.1 Na+ efflux pump ABC transporter permease [Niallia nealsonii AAU1]MBQ6449227.1 ABC transporter permease [Bacillus sp. (in: firmicutes)]MDU1846166.1 ABC transporter permease [Niallia nealsonii]MBZ9534928.1 ABC transporter permease [Cytobacillus oceanisediminis]MED3792004.1 ABC transporter permease [Niallia alba]
MNSFWIILFHTFLSKFKTKSFLITTAITLLFVVALTNLTTIIDTFSGEEGKTEVAVIDQSDSLLPIIQEATKTLNEDLELVPYKDSEESAKKEVEEGNYSGLLVVDVDSSNLPIATYYTMDIAETSISDNITNGIQMVKSQLAANQLNLTNEQLAKLNEPVSFEKIALEKDAKTEEELNQARGLVYVLLFLIYFAVILYANMIATEVATEKSSRVMEILISSVSPIKHMFAKILGIGLLSLTQLAILMIVGYFSLTSNESLSSMEGFLGFNEVPVSTIIYAAIFFILGYFLYATLAALLGSLVSRIEDVQQMITPMTLLIVAGFMIAMFGLSAPDTTFVTITSYIPFFTPMLMFMRVGMLNLPVWEPILGILVLVATIMILAIFGAKVYKGGVLMYGKSNSYKDIKKALQLTKKE